jgi:hypothetical protein
MDRVAVGNLLCAGWKLRHRQWRPPNGRTRNDNRGS